MPLKERRPVEERLNIVDCLKSDQTLRELLQAQFRLTGDLERLISKVAVGRVNPREVLQVRKALFAIDEIRAACMASGDKALMGIGEQLNTCQLIRDRIGLELQEDPPAVVNKGGVINIGFHADLDELREILYSGKDYLSKIQSREIQATGISSLKIGYNNVFGYFLEVTNAHKDKVPETWNRKQTLVNAERYITEELKDYEQKILGAEEKILAIETQLFNDLVVGLANYVQPIQLNANLIAKLDVLANFAALAISNRYNRPNLDDSTVLDIKNGRHPVIEKQLSPGDSNLEQES